MAALRGLGRLAKPLFNNRALIAATNVRAMGAWNKDWKPGPYPRTPQERVAAAKRYGLRPEDYEPIPDDGLGYGDYPKLPYLASDSRDDFVDWDDEDSKRNWGEVVHIDWDLISEQKFDPSDKWNDGPQTNYVFLFWTFTLVWWFTYNIAGFYYDAFAKFTPPYGPKQYLEEGKVHYTFEPVDK